MKKLLATIAVSSILAGCYSTSVSTSESGTKPLCSHTDQPVYRFERFSDGHHYLFGGGSKLVASINTKDGILTGQFEIYYGSGILKYWGWVDGGGHVISGKYNNTSYSFDDYNIRGMTVADKQNAQTELVNIMERGVLKEAGSENRSTKAGDSKNMVPTLWDCTSPSFSPAVGAVYEHDGRRLQVFQVIEDGVMVFGELNIFVETTWPYVDNEMLSAGRYEYVGPWIYETVEKKLRTIRRFKQVE